MTRTAQALSDHTNLQERNGCLMLEGYHYPIVFTWAAARQCHEVQGLGLDKAVTLPYLGKGVSAHSIVDAALSRGDQCIPVWSPWLVSAQLSLYRSTI